MSILNVNQIQPVGGGNTITVSASDVSASGATITASSFIGNVVGNVTSSSTSTFSSGLNVTGGNVGIGTDSAEALLDVEGIGQFGNNPLTDTGIQLNGSVGRIRVGRSGNVFEARNGSDSTIKASISGSTGGANFLGSVGIGTDNPAAELEVYGNGRFKDADGSHGIELYPDVAGLGYQRIISYNRTTSAYENLSIGVNDFVVTTGSSTERLRITSNGKIAFGNYTPTYDLDLLRTTSGVGATMRVGATAASGINTASVIINNGGIGNAVLDFKYESAATPRASIYVYRSDQELRFDTAGSEAARFTSTGNLKFPSGQGIDFSATADGGTTTPSELLDDYEEGTWTPNFTGVTYTASVQFGRYTKIGRYVYCTITIDGSISNGSSNIGLEGLPFSADEAGDNYQRSAWHPANGGHMVGLSINDARFRVNGSTMQGVKGATGNTTYMTGNQLTSGTFQFTGDFSYYTAS